MPLCLLQCLPVFTCLLQWPLVSLCVPVFSNASVSPCLYVCLPVSYNAYLSLTVSPCRLQGLPISPYAFCLPVFQNASLFILVSICLLQCPFVSTSVSTFWQCLFDFLSVYLSFAVSVCLLWWFSLLHSLSVDLSNSLLLFCLILCLSVLPFSVFCPYVWYCMCGISVFIGNCLINRCSSWLGFVILTDTSSNQSCTACINSYIPAPLALITLIDLFIGHVLILQLAALPSNISAT